MVIWIVGMSGAGKTTLAKALAGCWRAHSPNTVLVDGDEVRRVFGRDDGPDAYTIEGRRRNAERMAALCEMLDKQGINVVCAILSLFPDQRAENRRRFSRYFEVFLDAPLESLEARDAKGLYAAARAGRMRNVVGVDIPFPRPSGADLVIDTSGAMPEMDSLACDVLARAGVPA